MIEIPEHLLKRSKARRRALGEDVGDDDVTESPAAAATSAATPAAASAASKAPVPIPAGKPAEAEKPDSEWVAKAKSRKKIPFWVMPVLLFLPIWLILYVGTLEDPTREEGVIYEGSKVYVSAGCSGCHGATGGGGSGPAFSGGAVLETFATAEEHISWVVHGSQGYTDAGLSTYGTSQTAIGSFNGSLMPNFGAKLSAKDLIAVVFYERVELGGVEDELPLAEKAWELIESGTVVLPEHFLEGPDGDFDGTGAIAEALALAREELGPPES